MATNLTRSIGLQYSGAAITVQGSGTQTIVSNYGMTVNVTVTGHVRLSGSSAVVEVLMSGQSVGTKTITGTSGSLYSFSITGTISNVKQTAFSVVSRIKSGSGSVTDFTIYTASATTTFPWPDAGDPIKASDLTKVGVTIDKSSGSLQYQTIFSYTGSSGTISYTTVQNRTCQISDLNGLKSRAGT